MSTRTSESGFTMLELLVSTSISLIVIGVAMDFLQQIESHLNMRRYDGFLGKSGNVGRRLR